MLKYSILNQKQNVQTAISFILELKSIRVYLDPDLEVLIIITDFKAQAKGKILYYMFFWGDCNLEVTLGGTQG